MFEALEHVENRMRCSSSGRRKFVNPTFVNYRSWNEHIIIAIVYSLREFRKPLPLLFPQ